LLEAEAQDVTSKFSMVTTARTQASPERLDVVVKRVAEKLAAEQRGPEKSAAPIDRRSSTRSGSRGDKYRLSSPMIMNIVQALDLVLMLAGGLLSKVLLSLAYGSFSLFDKSLLLATIAGSVLASVFLTRSEAYVPHILRSVGTQLELMVLPLLVGGASEIVCLFMMNHNGLPLRQWPFVWVCSSALLLTTSRFYVSWLVRGWLASGRLARRVAVIGAGQFSHEFIRRLRSEPHSFTVVGLYDDRLSRIPAMQDGVRVRGTIRDLLARSREEQIDLIVIALPLRAVSRIATILEQVGSAVADVCLTTDFAGFRFKSSQLSSVGSNPVVLVGERPMKDWSAAKKRAFDLILGSLLLIGFSPFLALIAVAIRLDSPGPVLFRQPRLGFNNRLFTCYKFRSMHHGMTDLLGEQQATRGDARITRLGKWLRALSIDELPQLLNVIKGDMSLVGPRPHPPNTRAADKLFTEVVAKYAFRHRVKPGITGWAQVNGWRGETKTVAQIENRVSCDLAYIENWSILFDLRILILTLTREIMSQTAF
jgi:Undecaprenyl-phosphate glucose phosphotransferase